MTGSTLKWIGSVGVVLTIGAGIAQAQEPPPQTGTAQGQGAGRGLRGQGRQAGRGALPPAGPNMNQQQVQAWLDAYALVQAQRELQLTAEQYPDFVSRLTRLQNVRRRNMQERLRLLREMGGLLQDASQGRDEAIQQRLQSLDDLARRAADEVRRGYAELDGVLTPPQRARFRLFEEQLERRKIELLTKVGQGAGSVK